MALHKGGRVARGAHAAVPAAVCLPHSSCLTHLVCESPEPASISSCESWKISFGGCFDYRANKEGRERLQKDGRRINYTPLLLELSLACALFALIRQKCKEMEAYQADWYVGKRWGIQLWRPACLRQPSRELP